MSNSYFRQNPIRPADWRHRLARQQVDSGRLILFHDGDPWVAEIAKYLRLRKMNTSDAAKKQLAERMPRLDTAFQIHDASGGSLRDLLEAYLLTDQSASTISDKLGIASEVVRAYAAAFFDVADRLDQATFILQEVIFSDRSKSTPAGYMKLIGYLEGMAALDDFVERTGIGSANKLLNLIQEETRFLFLQKVLLALRERDVRDHRAAAELITMYARRKGDGKQADQQPDRLKEHIQAMMAALPFNVRGRDTEKVPPEVRKYQTSGVELGYVEHMQVSVGEKLENETELLAITFPPRPKAVERTANQETPETPPPAPPPQSPAVEAPAVETPQSVNPTLRRRGDSRRRLLHRDFGHRRG